MTSLKTYISLGFLCLFATFGLSSDKAYAADWDESFFLGIHETLDISFFTDAGITV
ncbi:MAG: hypothetical protein U9Q15_03295 [Patescibacteria group bacterium]|nr:hypothetical protein [Patescibacteria group bacterium]